MIKAVSLHKTYRPGEEVVHALRDVSLTIDQGEFVAIMGPSGSGKSTLLHILGLLAAPDSGEFYFCGHDVTHFNKNQLASLRNGAIGFVFQHFFLLPRTSVMENVSLPLLYSSRRTDPEHASACLRSVGVSTEAQRHPNQLSGGQQQRVAIARALINNPRLILADEPTGNLDSKNSAEIMRLLKDLNSRGMTVVLITHDHGIAAHAGRQITMLDGRIDKDTTANATVQVSKPEVPLPHRGLQEEVVTTHAPLSLREWLYFVREACRSIWANRLRASLSALGVLTGTLAVVLMMALVAGAWSEIEWQVQSMGTNLLILTSGTRQQSGEQVSLEADTRLNRSDAEAIRTRIPEVRETTATVLDRVETSYREKSRITPLVGTEPAYGRMTANQPTEGRFFTEQEVTERSPVALLGNTPRRELFGDENPIGRQIRINRQNYQVIGLLPEKGVNPWRDQDDLIMIPVSTAMQRLLGKEYVDAIQIEVFHQDAIAHVEEQVKKVLLARRHLDNTSADLFSFRNMARIRSSFEQISSILATLLTSVAVVSLIIGGIGIMNIMLVSITERTREIGIRKAIGAREHDIMIQFLVETTILSLAGGLTGIAGAWLISKALASAGWTLSITGRSALLGFACAGITGIIFGLWPALKAAHRDPVDSLRYE
jgi:macrolide transport system ATP-binding/permease protein